MQKIKFFLILNLMIFASHSVSKELEYLDPEKAGFSTDRLRRIAPVMQKYIDEDLTPGVLTAIMREGKLIYLETQGFMDVEAKKPLREDTIFRIASMTKPIASIALMMLWEEGHFQLNDPVSKFIPAFSETKVSTTSDASGKTGKLVKPKRAITIRDMLTHTAGLANNYIGNKEAYRKAMYEPRPKSNSEQINRLAKLALNYHPGEQWQYSSATSVVGHLVEIISGKSLDVFLEDRLFGPLDMQDTHFYLDNTKDGRLAAQYAPGKDKKIILQDPGSERSRWITSPRNIFSGSGGLVSTARDYLRFQQMILNKGELHGERILAPSTVSLILENHTGDLPIWLSGPGTGFGLGYGVIVDRGKSSSPLSEGSAYWGGAYCTISWIDPEKDIVGLMMTQVRPYTHINIRRDFQVLTYQAIVD
ncbi:MAG TPA: serine hydrolase domain-containing protein [SAR86 cluster bacterium]|jgi:CubicO group peptidase (beta-lactamase class C family)|nr:serine hydrolase domain-containing protein [SAR86 cluster bacterium]|tara:strand:- start:4751 stop:6007 length:1257 start_codon:yes stop_codon:yes gene_type:complete